MRCSRTNPNGRRLVIYLTWGQVRQKVLALKPKEVKMKVWAGVKDPRGEKLRRRGKERQATPSLILVTT